MKSEEKVLVTHNGLVVYIKMMDQLCVMDMDKEELQITLLMLRNMTADFLTALAEMKKEHEEEKASLN